MKELLKLNEMAYIGYAIGADLSVLHKVDDNVRERYILYAMTQFPIINIEKGRKHNEKN